MQVRNHTPQNYKLLVILEPEDSGIGRTNIEQPANDRCDADKMPWPEAAAKIIRQIGHAHQGRAFEAMRIHLSDAGRKQQIDPCSGELLAVFL